MENQSIPNSQHTQALNKVLVKRFLSPKQNADLLPILIAILLTATIFGAGGYYMGQNSPGSRQTDIAEKNETPSPNISNFTLVSLENLIDENKNVWKKYQDETFSFEYPVYLSDFRDLSADTQLAKDDEEIAGYYRSSQGISGGGRSYWIILKDIQPNTKGVDVKEWITKNKLNVLKDDSGNTEELPVENMTLGGSDAYRINFYSDSGTPRSIFVYFQTSLGVRGIGFHSWSSGAMLAKDYDIYTQILATMKFGNSTY
ncbi:hypothetical protein A2191_03590 [Candidatus Woesebacteria bacterium RIFOXYA1_FULL_38_9]|nr:MAG: hypothetical protein A2191_03590 [Candidatus Woesebacteria bacterium RIFOXYA1_FULL_38_9]